TENTAVTDRRYGRNRKFKIADIADTRDRKFKTKDRGRRKFDPRSGRGRLRRFRNGEIQHTEIWVFAGNSSDGSQSPARATLGASQAPVGIRVEPPRSTAGGP